MDNIVFLPLDVPLIKSRLDILTHFNDNHAETYVWWNMELLLGQRDLDSPLGSKDYPWNPRAKDKYPEIISLIKDHLPFENLYYVHLARAQKDILPHVDENYVERIFPHHMTITADLKSHLEALEPVGYRFIVSGRRDNFYLCKEYDPEYKKIIDQKKNYCHIPKTTDFFLIRNSRQPHGVDDIINDPDRLTGFILGSLNPIKHMDLIERSKIKFASSVKYSSDLG